MSSALPVINLVLALCLAAIRVRDAFKDRPRMRLLLGELIMSRSATLDGTIVSVSNITAQVFVNNLGTPTVLVGARLHHDGQSYPMFLKKDADSGDHRIETNDLRRFDFVCRKIEPRSSGIRLDATIAVEFAHALGRRKTLRIPLGVTDRPA